MGDAANKRARRGNQRRGKSSERTGERSSKRKRRKSEVDADWLRVGRDVSIKFNGDAYEAKIFRLTDTEIHIIYAVDGSKEYVRRRDAFDRGIKPLTTRTPPIRTDRARASKAEEGEPRKKSDSSRKKKRSVNTDIVKSEINRAAGKKKKRTRITTPSPNADVVPHPTCKWDDWTAAVEPPRDWSSPEYGDASVPSNCIDPKFANMVRLMGTATIHISVNESESPKTVLNELSRAVRCLTTIEKTRTYNRRKRHSFKCWNVHGEPSSAGYRVITVARILDFVDEGHVTVVESWAEHWLACVQALLKPTKVFFNAPALRVLCFAPGGGLAASKAKRPSEISSAYFGGDIPRTFPIRLHVYATRILFYLIAYDPVRTIMARLTPSNANGRREIAELPPSPLCFSSKRRNITDSSDADAAADFDIGALLHAHESTGFVEAPQPPGMRLRMMDYQRQGLAWMQCQERLEHGLNSRFWEMWRFADEKIGPPAVADYKDAFVASAKGKMSSSSDDENGRSTCDPTKFYYSPPLGELRLETPAVVRGGVLADEMGLGKTLQIVALILADKHERDERSSKRVRVDDTDRRIRTEATLIVVPAALVSQWVAEIQKSTSELRVIKYTHDDIIHDQCCRKCRPRCKQPSTCVHRDCVGKACVGARAHVRVRTKEMVDSADVVITTYSMLKKKTSTRRSSAGYERKSSKVPAEVLMMCHWRRIVLDEMQMVCSSTTNLAKNVREIRSDMKWMMSGTPLYNLQDGPKDLNGELAFLRVLPFDQRDTVDGFWGMKIQDPWTQRNPDALRLLNVLLSRVMLRRSKSQYHIEDGRPLLSLPKARNRVLRIPWQRVDNEERNASENMAEEFVYRFIERVSVEAVETGCPSSVTISLRNLLRGAATSSAIVNGGRGCPGRLSQLNTVVRRVRRIVSIGADPSSNGGNYSSIVNIYDPSLVPKMSCQDAMIALLSFDRNRSEQIRRERGRGGALNPTMSDQFVRTHAAARRNYGGNRGIAVETIQSRLSRAEPELRRLQREVIDAHRRSWFVGNTRAVLDERRAGSDERYKDYFAALDSKGGTQSLAAIERIVAAHSDQFATTEKGTLEKLRALAQLRGEVKRANEEWIAVCPVKKRKAWRKKRRKKNLPSHPAEVAAKNAANSLKEYQIEERESLTAETNVLRRLMRSHGLVDAALGLPMRRALNIDGGKGATSQRRQLAILGDGALPSEQGRSMLVPTATRDLPCHRDGSYSVRVTSDDPSMVEQYRNGRIARVDWNMFTLSLLRDDGREGRLVEPPAASHLTSSPLEIGTHVLVRFKKSPFTRSVVLMRWLWAVDMILDGRAIVIPTTQSAVQTECGGNINRAGGEVRQASRMCGARRFFSSISLRRLRRMVTHLRKRNALRKVKRFTQHIRGLKTNTLRKVVADLEGDLEDTFRVLGYDDDDDDNDDDDNDDDDDYDEAEKDDEVANEDGASRGDGETLANDGTADKSELSDVSSCETKILSRTNALRKILRKYESSPIIKFAFDESRKIASIQSRRHRKFGISALLSFDEGAKHVRACGGDCLNALRALYRSDLNQAQMAAHKIRELAPFVQVLRRAASSKGGQTSVQCVERAGMQQIMDLMRGVSPTCGICLDDMSEPTCIRVCTHMYCLSCILKVMAASPILSNSSNFRVGEAACPLCRQRFSVRDLLRVTAQCENDTTNAAPAASASKRAREVTCDDALSPPKYSSAATSDDLAAMASNLSMLVQLNRDPRYPALDATFLAALREATGLPVGVSASTVVNGHLSPKMRALVRLVREVDPEKVVVFSQLKAGVLHASEILKAEGIGHVRIVAGDRVSEQEIAVQSFNVDPSVRVFVLHAGQAAAGLTLTIARHVILLEPFLKTSEEAQALNRCHRIGQTSEVTCTILYTGKSIEERLLCMRPPSWMTADCSAGDLSVLSQDTPQSAAVHRRRNRANASSSSIAESGGVDRACETMHLFGVEELN